MITLVTASDVAMLALTLAGFLAVAMLPYGAFRLVEIAEDAVERSRDRAAAAVLPLVQPLAQH